MLQTLNLSQLKLGVNSRLFSESGLLSVFSLANVYFPVFHIKKLKNSVLKIVYGVLCILLLVF